MLAMRQLRWVRYIFLVLIVVLITPALVACGDDETSSGSASEVGDQEPVKIGILADWSGPFAKAGVVAQEVLTVIEKDLLAADRALGDRPVRFVTMDGYGTATETEDAVKAAVRDDQISALAGVAGGSLEAVIANIETVETIGLPYFTLGFVPEDLTGYRYSVRVGSSSPSELISSATDFVLRDLKPRRVAFLSDDSVQVRDMIARIKTSLQADGMVSVYEQYVDPGTAQFGPYLMDMNRTQPDLLMSLFASPSSYLAVFRDVSELGGWGDTDYFCLHSSSQYSAYLPAAQGTYHFVQWLPESSDPMSRKFVQAFEDEHGRPPEGGHFLYYTAVWTAIHAIELAGSDDPEAIAQAARSGDLVWNSPAGPYRIGTDGEHTETLKVAVVEDGNLMFLDSD